MSKMRYFSSVTRSIFRQHSAGTGTYFDTKNMEIGTLSNVSFET